MRRISLQGRDWLNPSPPRTAWQREVESGPLLPLAQEFEGKWAPLAWLLTCAVGVLFGMALTMLVVS